MELSRKTQLVKIMCAYLVFILLFSVDLFVISPFLTFINKGFISQALCLVYLLFFSKLPSPGYKRYFFSIKNKNVLSAAKYAFIFSAVPFIFIFAVQFVYRLFNSTVQVQIGAPMSLYNGTGILGGSADETTALIIYIALAAVIVIFQEYFFRGIVYHSLRKIFSSKDANLIQSALYTVFTLPFLFYILSAADLSSSNSLLVVFLHVTFHFVFSLKFGYYRAMFNNFWIYLFEHFTFVVCSTTILFLPSGNYIVYIIFSCLISQIFSSGMFYIYLKNKGYGRNHEKIEQKLRVNETLIQDEESENVKKVTTENFYKLYKNSKNPKSHSRYFYGYHKQKFTEPAISEIDRTDSLEDISDQSSIDQAVDEYYSKRFKTGERRRTSSSKRDKSVDLISLDEIKVSADSPFNSNVRSQEKRTKQRQKNTKNETIEEIKKMLEKLEDDTQ